MGTALRRQPETSNSSARNLRESLRLCHEAASKADFKPAPAQPLDEGPELPEILDRAAETLEDRSPLEILEWAFEQFPGQLTLATAFGAEGIALIDMAVRVNPNVDIFSLDTGFFFPETYRLWDEVEKKYGISIRRMTPALSPTEQDQVHGPRLWERDPNLCCAIRKLAPLQHALAGFDGWITAIRRDQTPSRANAKTVEWDRRWQKVKMNPLARWARDDVWRYVIGNKLPYNPLHDVGYSSIGCTHCTRAVGAGEDERAGRWAGSEKTECGLHYETAKPGDRLNVELQALDRAPATLAVQGA